MRAGFSRHFASVRIVLPDRMVVHYPAMIPRVQVIEYIWLLLYRHDLCDRIRFS